ncbi:putative surface layer protein [Oscillibacter valericigenes Sjm18-20]|nr:putative surface layer protein [Oscillibacter valericigenes Sjm18-20]
MKKIISVVLTILLMLTCVVKGISAEEHPRLWAQAAAEDAQKLCITTPAFLNSVQDYAAPITRGQFAELAVSFVAAQYGFEAPNTDFIEEYFCNCLDPNGKHYVWTDFVYLGENRTMSPEWVIILNEYYRPFSDVTGQTNREFLIRAAALMGLVKGRSNGTYDPNGTITRQEAAVILTRIYERCGGQLGGEALAYPDQDEIGAWALPSVKTVTALGVMNGKSDGGFQPVAAYTVEQSIVTFDRLFAPVQALLPPLYIGADGQAGLPDWVAKLPDDLLVFQQKTDLYTLVCVGHESGSPSGGILEPVGDTLYIISPKGGYKSVTLPHAPNRESITWNQNTEQLFYTVTAYDVNVQKSKDYKYVFNVKDMSVVLLGEKKTASQ